MGVLEKKKNNDELFDFTSRLIAFRKMHPIFQILIC